ncbi:epidermal growth factor receptor kinase substrate 8-like protein 3b [Echeneis naucrates]|uniref:epidermal growth factor receptor kinase substrate 8-like protein 3b n=1 Tax=Echeneis naucrates TaxID=173247 RepID=UPI0011139EE9|nr:epidermal growth factor receptor kinase substrate 8-like protein 3 [Echeneis naucrates]
MYGNSGPFTYSPRGFSQEDLPQQRRPFQQEELKGAPLQRNGMTRPSGRHIYMQRKEYSELLNKKQENFHARVEHLFTCELDGRELKTVDNCVAKLKRLHAKSRLWPQEMIMDIQGGYLLLSDIETKTELEALPLSGIKQTKAVLDSCAYNSLLTITVQTHNKPGPQVFMFQCEETGAPIIKGDLDQAVRRADGAVELGQAKNDTRASFWQAGPRPVLRENTPPPHDPLPPQWGSREQESMPIPRVSVPPDFHNSQSSPNVLPEQRDTERNLDILNHVVDDLEIFLAKVYEAANTTPPQRQTSAKKNMFRKKKSNKSAATPPSLPPWEEYTSCLQKIKYGLNLLGQLNGSEIYPSVTDYVHIFFNILQTIVPQYPEDMPLTVVSPLLIESAIQLLSQVVSPEEDRLWISLGDPWNIPRSNWVHGDVPPYIPVFYNGWQPPPPSQTPPNSGPPSRSNSQRFPSGRPNGQINEPVTNSPWASPAPSRSNEAPLHMRVIYNFMARNNQELSVMKGDTVQVIQKSKQWWLVRNARQEEGNVPQNVLEPITSAGPTEEPMWETRGSGTLDMSSTSAEVKAWLQSKGFSKITVASLGVLNGKLLLGMSKDEIRAVCPEEAGKVFFQLQAIKSAIALASEPSGMYNGHY